LTHESAEVGLMTACQNLPMQGLHFNSPATLDGWTAIDDRVMGGVSSSRLAFNLDGHAVFEGEVSTDNGGGFASVRHPALRLGERDTVGYCLHVRGDGKRYKLNLRMERGLDGVNHQAVFQPPAGRWVDIVLPLNHFSPRFRGQPVPDAPPLRPEKVCQVGWMVADGQIGPFQLAIRTVSVLGQTLAL
jgi:NADH dehydrogenase [ubiquinone] 1 alpha subcomplex assembly factor 1